MFSLPQFPLFPLFPQLSRFTRPFILAAAISSIPAFAAYPVSKPIPPAGIAVPDADRAELTAGVAALGNEIESLKKALKPDMLALLPDVQIFHKSVDWALRYDEFFNPKQIAAAKAQLALGMQRAKELKEGNPSWETATGLVVRGYVSKIDGSVQPYGVVVPEAWKAGDHTQRRLDFWMHGRGENLSELSFVEDRMKNKGEFVPEGAFVLHLYGRYCCANKFAGEVDLFEALDNARKHYPIDEKRLVARGFSMGGASAWQFGTHYASMWAAVQPGAGFGESKEFLHLNTPEKMPPVWEQTLWRWYDSTGYVSNLVNTTTVGYSGEIDGQKQAADIMIRYARQEAGIAKPPVAELGKVAEGDGSPKAEEARVTGTAPDLMLYHVIGPKTPHKVLAEAKPEIEKLIGAALEKHQTSPKKVHLTTYSLIYPKQDWVMVQALERQWERADVDAEVAADGSLQAKTKGVRQFTVTPVPARLGSKRGTGVIDGQTIALTAGAYGLEFVKDAEGKWACQEGPKRAFAGKNQETCGPIDHAFMSSFVMVRPTGKPLNETVGGWAKDELEHATTFWRKVFRGDAPVKDDSAVTPQDISQSNLVLWGDPSSNAVLAKILPQLPIKWDAGKIEFGGKTYDAANHAPILIFPNPLNPKKYVVINSGVTFREEALLNNAQQTPKLPDWAIVDLRTAPGPLSPGLIEAAGFFNENWQADASK